MKNWLFISSLLFFMFTATANAQEINKIAVVNVKKIFDKLPVQEIVTKKLKNEFKEREGQLQNIKRDLEIKIQNLHHDKLHMQDNDRNKFKKEITLLREQFLQKIYFFEQDNHRRQIEEQKKILNHIYDVATLIAKKEGYNIVINNNSIIYANPDQDITDHVIQQVK
ncbi:Chaperone protein Skp [Candidatus Ecksteinia adelgidicola]|nr:Chaperone protein Skp [Candidatus Ecksteinia adelgidicola]